MTAMTLRNGSLLDRFFNDLESSAPRGNATPDVQIKRNENAYKVVAHLPGFSREDVKIEIENGNLVIHAKRAQESKDSYETVHAEFRQVQEYTRTLRLAAAHFDVDRVEAKLENGVLEVTLPLREAVKPRKVEIR